MEPQKRARPSGVVKKEAVSSWSSSRGAARSKVVSIMVEGCGNNAAGMNSERRLTFRLGRLFLRRSPSWHGLALLERS